ncbi:MAG: hypothetical protein ACXWXM_05490, partial [Actinomycetota bacterium]
MTRKWLAVLVLVSSLTTPSAAGAEDGSRGLPPFHGSVSTIDSATRHLMVGSSWRPGCPVPLRDLRLLRLTYYGFDGRAHRGGLVVHRWYAGSLVHVFRR